jgi:hypothetical protein
LWSQIRAKVFADLGQKVQDLRGISIKNHGDKERLPWITFEDHQATPLGTLNCIESHEPNMVLPMGPSTGFDLIENDVGILAAECGQPPV